MSNEWSMLSLLFLDIDVFRIKLFFLFFKTLVAFAHYQSARKLGNKRFISTLSEWRYFHYL